MSKITGMECKIESLWHLLELAKFEGALIIHLVMCNGDWSEEDTLTIGPGKAMLWVDR